MNAIERITNIIRMDSDQRTQQHIAQSSNKLKGIADIGQRATEEITNTFIHSEYQVSQALVAKKAIEAHLEAAGVSPQEYQLLLTMQTQLYLKTVTRVLQDGAEAISEEAARSYR